MTFPQLAGKHALDALVPLPPAEKFPDLPAPESVILCYPRWLFRDTLAAEQTTRYPWQYRGDVHILPGSEGRVAVAGGMGVGAPAAAMLVEELGAHGVRNFVILGLAGGLQPELRAGAEVLCDKALRDEGVSQHYLAPGQYVDATPELTSRLEAEFRDAGIVCAKGPSWTTDAPYRETREEARKYREEGIQTVEMEAAAVFAVARVRGYSAAAAFVVSDTLADEGWTGYFRAEEIKVSLRRLLPVIRRALVG
jgi:uridine phosphorylase